jgi:peptide/nickel transport system permease protein
VAGLFLNEDVYFSYTNFVPVKEEIFARLPVSAASPQAAITWLLIGIPVGIVSAVRRHCDGPGGMVFALLGVSMVFWLGCMPVHLLVQARVGAPASRSDGVWEAVLRAVICVDRGLAHVRPIARMVRGNLMETMGEDYIRTARAKGLSEKRVIYKHGLRAALTPVVTMFGLDLAVLLGGAFITETVFGLPGVGQYAVRSIFLNDFPAVMGVTLFAAFFIAIANLCVDIAYAFLDPRVRYT